MITSGMVRFHDGLAPLMRGIDEVQQHPDNYNNGDLDKIIESVEINGVYRPIYVTMDTDYIVRTGHAGAHCAGEPYCQCRVEQPSQSDLGVVD